MSKKIDSKYQFCSKECSCDGGRLIGVRENDVDEEAVGGVPAGVIKDIVDIFEKETKTGVGGEYLYNMLILSENNEVKKEKGKRRRKEKIRRVSQKDSRIKRKCPVIVKSLRVLVQIA